MTQEEESRLRQNLKIPTARPAVEDGTMEAWLKRLEIVWGTVNISHEEINAGVQWKTTRTTNTNQALKRTVTQAKFIKEVNDPEMVGKRGKFDIDELEINKISYSRSWVDEDGKERAEQYLIVIDLKDDLKKALKKPFWKIW